MAAQDSKGECDVCRKPAKQLCSSCKAVFYCSKDCQKRGWKDHKTKCRPFTLQVHPIYGRHLVATRDIKAGEVILKESPLIIGPKHKSVPLCLSCHKPAREHKCSKCRYPVCGAACETAKSHKDECAILSRKTVTISTTENSTESHPAYTCITALRCLLTSKTDPKKWELINTLQDHLSEIKKSELYQVFSVNIVDYLRNYLEYVDHDEETIMKICGILITNGYELKQNGSRIRGLYHLASKLAHSCTPNTKHAFEDNLTVVFISTVKIAKGASLTTNYTQILWNTMARRQHLKMTKFFMCACPRCSDPSELDTQLSTLLCDKCGAGVMAKAPLNLETEWACNKCQHVLSAKQVRWGDAVLYRELREVDKGSTAQLESFLIKYKTSLHSQNRFFVEAKYALVKMYGNHPNARYRDLSRGQLENKVKYCRELLALAAVVDPGMSLLRGSMLFELQSALVALAKHLLSNDVITNLGAQEYMEEAAKVVEEASIILKHEPDLRDGGLNDRLAKMAEELDI